MTKIRNIGICLIIAITLLILPVFAQNSQYLIDDADLLTDGEESSLYAYLSHYSDLHNIDIVIVTTNSTGGQDIMDYADDYFDYNGYGRGSGADGVILVVDMGGREVWISTSGSAISAMTDAGIDLTLDDLTPYLSNGDYNDAFESFIASVNWLYEQYEAGTPYDVGSNNVLDSIPLTVAGKNTEYVIDDADLLSESDERMIYNLLAYYGYLHNIDIVIVTTESTGGQDIKDYADDYFDYNGYGRGDGADGVILVLDMGSRYVWISTSGSAIAAMTDVGIDLTLDEMIPYLRSGNYSDAFKRFVNVVDLLFEQYENGNPYDSDTNWQNNDNTEKLLQDKEEYWDGVSELLEIMEKVSSLLFILIAKLMRVR